MSPRASGYPQRHGGHGRRMDVYADRPIKRSCACPDPVVYKDEDDDTTCFRCGHRLDPPVARVA